LRDLKPRTIILTSGTLSPLDDLETDIGIEFPIKISNNHVISSDRVLPRIISNVNSYELRLNFTRRNNTYMINDFGHLLLNVAERISGGILVFFPSY
jgi:regulator of telomere elongation helicase 1